HPEYRHVSADTALPAGEQRLTPIYPSTAGFTQISWRRLSEQALARLDGAPGPLLPDDCLPPALRLSLTEALRFLHRPPAGTDLAMLAEGRHPFQQRLVFEELLAHQLSLRRLRQRARRQQAPALHDGQQLAAALRARLPFALTDAQQRAVAEILA